MGHAGASDGLHQSLLDDALLYVQSQLTCSLLGCAPADSMGQAGNILDLFGLYPLRFLRDRSCAVVYALGNFTHCFYFM